MGVGVRSFFDNADPLKGDDGKEKVDGDQNDLQG